MIHSPNGIKAGPDGNLYIASSVEQAILVMNPETGEIIKRLGIEVGVDGPDDIEFGPDGSLYWTDFFRGSVGRLKPDGSISNQMVAPGVNPIAFSADGRLFTALGFLGDALYELDPNLVEPPRLLAENLGQLNSFQFGPDGLLYAPVMKKGQVVRIDVNVDPIEIEVVTEGLQCWLGWPVAAKFDSQGQLYVEAIAEGAVDGIARVDIATGARETFAAVPYGMDNFAIDANDRFFAVLLADGSVGEIMPDGSFRLLGPVGFVMPSGIAVMPRADGESVFLADTWSLREYDGATGELRSKKEGLAQPATMAADGETLVMSSWFGNSVQVWNPQTQEVLETYYDFNVPLNAIRFQGDLIVAELGSSSVVRANGADPTQRTTLASGLGIPLGLAADGDNLWVGDRATGKVWQLIAGGELLAEPRLTAGGLDRPEGMALTPEGHLLVAETGADRLVAINPVTGSVSTVAGGLGFNTRYPFGAIPSWLVNSVAVGQAGVVYVTADLTHVIYRIEPNR
jgi:sugar lactone lactonase YvrE